MSDAEMKLEMGDEAPTQVDELDVALARLQESPHDTEGWKRAIDLAESMNDMSRIRKAYDALLKQFPNNPSAQAAYINHFLVSKATSSEAEELLNKFLRTSPAVDLWRCYLDYVQGTNQHSAQTRETIRKAFEFALNHIGQDRDSGFIHAAYIKFLNEAETTTTWDTQQKMDGLRKVYHRAVQIPLDNVEKLWSDLEAFENGLNKITAKKFMADLSPAHMQARTVLRQLSTHLNGLNLNSPTNGLILPVLPSFNQADRQLVARWKAYLKWEEGNPLEIDDKDKAALINRIQLMYRKALVRMRYYPEIWFMAYSWNLSVGNTTEAISILKQGLEANPDSHSLTYAYAEQLELLELNSKKEQREYAEVHALYERFFAILRANLVRLSQVATVAPTDSNSSPPDPFGDEPMPDATKEANSVENPMAEELSEHKKQYSNVWINYMRFSRRSQGHKAARDAFGKARRDEYTGWEVFEAAALTEYRCNLDDGRDVAARIFEMGMKKYATEPQYVLSHLGFLLTVNDENNARALFERVINTFTPQQAKPIWERWSRSQYMYDDLKGVLELERRMAEVYQNDAPIKRFAQRHTYHSIDPIADHDLGFSKSRKQNQTAPGTQATPSNGPNSLAPSSSLPNLNSNKRPPPPPDRKPPEHNKRPRQDRPPARYSPPPRRDPSPARSKEDPRHVTLPAKLYWFVQQLPPPETYDGPLFNAELLLERLKGAVILSQNKSRTPPPQSSGQPSSPPTGRSNRPPPDYGPYQGPNSNPTRRGRY
ncbi:CFIA complex component [Mycena indigotica]|uniref:mRNA 3'-end-processing protein RNA14 n=1 Tax=Mycena indigotica TaxID=2126181 RepID=A0A8H6SMV9_9AGAR|nr:CFIA complex component [Mycena indigotica]KAF7301152.1 CFIA complex component [Mycena indigotica]